MKTVYKLIKLNRFLRNYRLKFLAILLADLIGIRHLFLRLDPVNACNLKCQMCYFSDHDYAKKIRGRFSDEEIDRIQQLFFRKALQLVVGCASEPTLHKKYLEIIRMGKLSGVPYIGLTTNGQLLDKSALEKLIDYGLSEITISVHGVNQETYERMMTGADFSRLLEVLSLLEEVKQDRGVAYPALRINYTTNAENLEELGSFFEVFGKYKLATLQVRPMVDVGHTDYEYQRMDSRVLTSYGEVIDKLSRECHSRGVVLLATNKDPNFDQFDKGTSYILPAVLRTIHPNKVWMTDFNWRAESYRQYCRRTGWRSLLWRTVIGREEVFKQTKHYLTYDVGL